MRPRRLVPPPLAAMKAREQREFLARRVPVLQVAFMAALVTIAGFYWFVQLVQGSHYRELAETNRFRRLQIRAPRGLVFDRHERLLADNVPSYNLLLDRSRTGDVAASLAFAARALGRSRESLGAALEAAREQPPYAPVLLAENLRLAEVARLAAGTIDHPEFDVDIGHLRLYRQGTQVAHVLGHLGEASPGEVGREEAGYRPGDLVGKRGIEQTFDRLLRGRDGERVVVVDHRGVVREEYGKVPATPGRSLQLTLDLDVQQAMARYFEEEGKVGAAVALDPSSGEIVGLYSAPSYDPNLFSRRLGREDWEALLADPHHPLQNRAIQNVYSPGSVFKVVLAVAGLAEGVIQPGDSVACGGSAVIYGRRFRCWKRGGHGRVDLAGALRQSCDVYFYHLGQRLGIERIAHYARLFDFGSPTGIDIAGEKSGLVPDPEWSLATRRHPWYPGETISVAIGQGPLLVSPLQIAAMMATVANGGLRVTPHLVRVGRVEPPRPVGIDRGALARVREGLRGVVEGGTGSIARVPGLEIGGKTGTVQVVSQETWIDSARLRYEHRDHAWFAAYASDGERLLVAVVFVEHGGKGSQVAAPLARRLFETYYAGVLEQRRAS